MKMDGYNTLKEVKRFISEVESMNGVNKNKLSLAERKAFLIAVANQLHDTINMIETKNL